MKQIICLPAALLLAAALCTGCAGNAPAAETDTAAVSTQATTVAVTEDTEYVFEAEIDFSDLP